MLCATIKNDDVGQIELANHHADLMEFSHEILGSILLKETRALCKKPVIFKLDRLDLEKCALLPDYVDLPHHLPNAVFDEIKQRFPTIKRICSYHDFTHSGNLQAIHEEIAKKPAEIYKIALMAHSTIDALNMLKCVKQKGVLGISMGECGQITRILAPVFGAPWSYAPLDAHSSTAPGQLLLQELQDIYHYHRLKPSTKLYGLIGDPIDKSMGHLWHNQAFRQKNADAVYVKMRLDEQQIDAAMPMLEELGFRGVSVTMPLKERLGNYLSRLHSDSINTIGFDRGFSQGWNTDGKAALDAIEARAVVKDKLVVILGAGGAAKGIALEAKKRGANLIIINRNYDRARSLAYELDARSFSLENFPLVAKSGYDILINATSCGMEGQAVCPIDLSLLLEKKVVMDVVSRPSVTPFLQAALDKQCQIISGKEMFTLQAQEQHKLWKI